jgi:hypothetical protein
MNGSFDEIIRGMESFVIVPSTKAAKTAGHRHVEYILNPQL